MPPGKVDMKILNLIIPKDYQIIGTEKYGVELYKLIEREIDYDNNELYEIVIPTNVQMLALTFLKGFFKSPISNNKFEFFITNVKFKGNLDVINEIEQYLSDNSGLKLINQ